MSTKQSQLQEELEKARAELAGTVGLLGDQLDPRAQAGRAAGSAKQAASDTAALFTGKGMPDQAHRARNVKVVLVATVAVSALVLRRVLHRS